MKDMMARLSGRLKGKEISLGARILCVADSFDAMVSDRPYSKSMSKEDAFKNLRKMRNPV